MIQQFHSWVYIWKKPLFWKYTCTPVFNSSIIFNSQVWNQVRCSLIDKLIKKMCRIYSAMRKREILPSVNNIDEPWGHYAKWNKSVTERQILNAVTALWHQRRKAKLKETEGWVVVARDWRVKETGSNHRVHTFSYKMDEFWGI